MRLAELNSEIKGCQRCDLAETRSHVVCGEGNHQAGLMLVAQAPGEEEDKEGEMFIGPSGQILDQLLQEAGVDRTQVYLTNLIKCLLPDYRKPKQEEIDACSPYLDREVELVQPQTLVPLGWYATRYLLKKYERKVPEDKSSAFNDLIWLDSEEMKLFPLGHPASLLYDRSLQEEMEASYRKLGVISQPCKWYSVCPMKKYYEGGKLGRRWIELYCKGDWESCVRFQKEERGEEHEDWMLPNGELDPQLREVN